MYVSGGLLTVILVIWMAVAVGPWYVGVLALLGALCFNLLVELERKKRGPPQ